MVYGLTESMRGALARVCLIALVYSFGSADGLCSAQYGQHLLGHFRPASITVPIDLRLRGGAAADDTAHGTKCTFRVRVDRIKPGESVVLIGSWCKWQIANAVELTASAELNPCAAQRHERRRAAAANACLRRQPAGRA